MKVDLFDFDLPEDRIATEPAEPRESARLLCVEPDGLVDRTIGDLPHILRAGDLLVFNDTRVIPAQLEGARLRQTGGGQTLETPIGATLHRRIGEAEWLCFVRGARKIRVGDRLRFGPTDAPLAAQPVERLSDGSWRLRFDVAPGGMIAALHRAGSMPLPPYITAKRAVRASDAEDYQTIFAAREGAVAAPTAGLHFTEGLLARLAEAGIGTAAITLHVGAGTFLPVKVEDTEDHAMHVEWGEVPEGTAAAIARTREAGGRIVAVGTTSLRIMEASARANGAIRPWSGETDIFITPGQRILSADMLLTNFHLPRSTLFMLVSAFSGLDRMRAAYAHAIEEGYRFYSYGDACLLTLSRPDG